MTAMRSCTRASTAVGCSSGEPNTRGSYASPSGVALPGSRLIQTGLRRISRPAIQPSSAARWSTSPPRSNSRAASSPTPTIAELPSRRSMSGPVRCARGQCAGGGVLDPPVRAALEGSQFNNRTVLEGGVASAVQSGPCLTKSQSKSANLTNVCACTSVLNLITFE